MNDRAALHAAVEAALTEWNHSLHPFRDDRLRRDLVAALAVKCAHGNSPHCYPMCVDESAAEEHCGNCGNSFPGEHTFTPGEGVAEMVICPTGPERCKHKRTVPHWIWPMQKRPKWCPGPEKRDA